MNPSNHPDEAVGASFDEKKLILAQQKAWKVLALVAQDVKSGMTEREIETLAQELFLKAGCEKHWHRPMARVGENTLCTFLESSDSNRVVQASDIIFLDFGPVFEGHEADVGATLVVGSNPEHERLANAASILFGEVAESFRKNKKTGKELYQEASERAKRLGVVLVTEINGHRVADFPHAIYSRQDLGQHDFVPQPKRWVLEIQIRHPTLPIGAFYEDML